MHPKNWGIGQIGDPQGVSTLVFLLDDENQHVRRAAARRRDLSYRLELGHDILQPHLPIRLHQTVGYSPRQLICWRARFHLPHSDPVGFNPNPSSSEEIKDVLSDQMLMARVLPIYGDVLQVVDVVFKQHWGFALLSRNGETPV